MGSVLRYAPWSYPLDDQHPETRRVARRSARPKKLPNLPARSCRSCRSSAARVMSLPAVCRRVPRHVPPNRGTRSRYAREWRRLISFQSRGTRKNEQSRDTVAPGKLTGQAPNGEFASAPPVPASADDEPAEPATADDTPPVPTSDGDAPPAPATLDGAPLSPQAKAARETRIANQVGVAVDMFALQVDTPARLSH